MVGLHGDPFYLMSWAGGKMIELEERPSISIKNGNFLCGFRMPTEDVET